MRCTSLKPTQITNKKHHTLKREEMNFTSVCTQGEVAQVSRALTAVTSDDREEEIIAPDDALERGLSQEEDVPLGCAENNPWVDIL